MSTLWVIGDSTLSAFEDKYHYPRYGYGTMLQEYLSDEVKVCNIALSGRSSKSYLEEPEYNQLLEGMKRGDFLIIGFGHNDEKTEAGRFTSANGDYKTEGSFARSLYDNYILPAVKVGCQPILATSIVRRTPTGEWKNQELHITADAGDFKGGNYPESIKQLSKDLKDNENIEVPVVDMAAITKKLYDEFGPENTVYLHAWPSNNVLSVDNTHTNIWGARLNAHLILSEIKDMNINGLSNNIINLENDMPYPSKEKYLISNKDYIPTVFSSDLPDSKLWDDYVDANGNIFKGTVFGDVLIKSDKFKEKFTLETDKDGNMHIKVIDSCGKISPTTDGIAMYYKKVSTKKNFSLSATMVVNDYFSNDQVSFGLMVRDDIYIDKETPDILGDYVAAASLYLTRKDKAYNCFARKSGVQVNGGTVSREYKAGEEIKVKLTSTEDGYAATFGDENTVTGGFDFKLTAIDPENVYVGMFVSRFADVVFKDIEFSEF